MYAVVLAGGGGTRLWPLSTPERPKPFLRLIGDETLVQRSVARLAPLVEPADVYVVTDRRYLDLAREQLPAIPESNLLGEPMGRNTAAAVALAAEAIARPADEVMLVLPADAHIVDEAGLRAALAVAGDVATGDVAAGGSLVTLGVMPDRPETGYGYILARPPARVVGGRDTYAVDRFLEKPTTERAQELIATRLASWNAGIFVWTRAAIRDGLSRHAPDIVGPIRAICSSGAMENLSLAYPLLRATSIDYAVMEPASLEGAVAVVPIDVGWSDLGSWAALRDAWQEESRAAAGRARAGGSGAAGAGAVGAGNVRDIDSSNSLVLAGDRLVVTIGLSDTIVVDTPEALLVCSADRSQEVRTIAEEMARAARPNSTVEAKP
ncbi:MAG: sugar phosphate nucleotidyltransferase [Candidatus Limnocylindrales bacterium]